LGIVTRVNRAVKEILRRKKLRVWEAPQPKSYEEQLYAALARGGDVCFDVGANQGDVSNFLAKLVGESGVVVAFEPVWEIYSRLCTQVQCDSQLKSSIITVPYGLSDIERDATIHVPNGNFGMGSMADAVAWAKAQMGAAIDAYRVRFTTLDLFLSTTGLRPPTFMKIDVEGAEMFVLRGATAMFSGGHRPLMLIEVFAPWEKAFGYQPWELFSWLLERGYRFLFACPDGLREYLPTEARPFPQDYEFGYNVIAYNLPMHSERIEKVQHLRAGSQTKLLPMAPPPQPNHIC
jgi:FkbM family methyltransferase